MLSDRSGLTASDHCEELKAIRKQVVLNLQHWTKLLYFVPGKDRGREAWHYVLIDGVKKEMFLEATKTGSLDVADYGQVLRSGWGKEPPASLRDKTPNFSSLVTTDLRLIKGQDNSWHYVLVDKSKRLMFEEQFKIGLVEEIEDCVTFLYSGWGQDPPDSIARKIIGVYLNADVSLGVCNKHSNLLHDFARSGKVKEMRQIIDRGFDINDTDNNGWTPLHHAALSGKVEVVKLLIDNGANIHHKDKTCGRKPVHIAAREGHENIIKFFLDRGAKVDDADRNDWLPLHYASCKGNVKAIKLLIDRGSDINAKDTINGKKPIHVAAANGHADIIDIFLKNKISIDDVDIGKRTPLFYASWYGQLATVDYLIHKGANIHSVNIYGAGFLHIAAIAGQAHIVERFLSEGLSVDVRSFNNWTPLHLSVYEDQFEVTKMLIEKGADVHAEDNEGATPLDFARKKENTKMLNLLKSTHIKCCPSLHVAAMRGDLKAVKFFLSEDVDVNAINKKNYTPLHYAAEYGNLHIVSFLLGKGADVLTRCNPNSVLHSAVKSNEEEIIKLVLSTIRERLDISPYVNAKNSDGDTPLILAAKRGNLSIVQMLVEHGADVHMENDDGLTALHLAAEEGHLRVVQFLVDKGADIHATNNDCSEPIHYAAACCRTDVMGFLVSQGASVNSLSNFGTPLHCAAYAGNLKTIDFLVHRNAADIHALNIAGMKPIHCAIMCDTDVGERNNIDIIEFLLKKGASINDTDATGKTLLHYSALQRKLQIVKFLVRRGASSLKDRYGKTPLDWAKEKNYLSVVELLVMNE